MPPQRHRLGKRFVPRIGDLAWPGGTMTNRITIRKPDDWHLHVRDGAMLKAVLPYTAKNFGRAILMPNLVPPVRTTKDAIAYRQRVLAALPKGSTFQPLMTCYL